ncbi:MAG: hypothetical protein Q6L60_15025 [Thermostichus sp. HHBFW_bins_43]
MATYTIHLIHKKRQLDRFISVDENTTILKAAEDQDIDLPFSRQSGGCSSYVGKMLPT